MKLERWFLATAVVALLIAIPVTATLRSRTNQLKMERTQKAKLELNIKSVQKQLEEKDRQLKQEQKENVDLKNQVQAKADAKAAASVQLATVTARVSYSTNCEAYRGIIAQYPWNVDSAMRVMGAESGCNPYAVSPVNYDGLKDHGLFQLHGQAVYDPAQNVAIAYQKYAARGWQPWTVCTKGIVLCQ